MIGYFILGFLLLFGFFGAILPLMEDHMDKKHPGWRRSD
tara:strand:+ start:1110 stop:1226 length:117 start_codon:yes stop_codon:yes gene_type:complete